MITRNQIINEARSWIGTPFHWQCSKKGVGSDCLGLIKGIVLELNIKSSLGYDLSTQFPTSYQYHKDRDVFLNKMFEHCIVSSRAIGSIVILGKKDRGWHIGIIGDYRNNNFSIIHASIEIGKVVEHRFIELDNLKILYFDFFETEKI